MQEHAVFASSGIVDSYWQYSCTAATQFSPHGILSGVTTVRVSSLTACNRSPSGVLFQLLILALISLSDLESRLSDSRAGFVSVCLGLVPLFS